LEAAQPSRGGLKNAVEYAVGKSIGTELCSTSRMPKKRPSPHRNITAAPQAPGALSGIDGHQPALADAQPLVGVIMGSASDWETMEHVAKTLADLGVPHETRVVSAHRTPDLLFEYASSAESRGIEVIIAGAGGAAHLPGMTASKTVLPVLGVPVESKTLKGLDSLLSIAQMPGGVPVGTLAIGKAGAINSALLAAAILGAKHPAIREALRNFRIEQTKRVLANPDPAAGQGASFRLSNIPPSAKKDPA
jgi:5-(carboxyamino)imidazole ribonucleotide mutase